MPVPRATESLMVITATFIEACFHKRQKKENDYRRDAEEETQRTQREGIGQDERRREKRRADGDVESPLQNRTARIHPACARCGGSKNCVREFRRRRGRIRP